MLRALFSLVLLLLVAFGLAGTNVHLVASAVAESADEDVSSERREEKSLRNSAARRSRARGRTIAASALRARLEVNSNKARLPSKSLLLHHPFGKSPGLPQILRI
jgi:hypothetical protein